jgi:hypothetical protein
MIILKVEVRPIKAGRWELRLWTGMLPLDGVYPWQCQERSGSSGQACLGYRPRRSLRTWW